MNKVARGCEDAVQFAANYVNYVSKLLSELDTAAIAAFIGELERTRIGQNTVFIVGNGGSAATASHMASDFSIGTDAGDGTPSIRALALTDNMAAITAIANDAGYHNIFVYQLRTHYRPGDILVAISASGNSSNVVSAARWVKRHGGKIIGLIGFNGGKLKSLCDVTLHVKTAPGEYGPVEDIHMVIDHLVYTWLRRMPNRTKQ